MSRMTPWGKSQSKEKFISGCTFYSTASHGGICISKKKAEKELSSLALSRAIDYNNAYWFEEDCNYAIPVFEIKELKEKFMEKYPACTEEVLVNSLKRWNPEYYKNLIGEDDVKINRD